MPVLPFGEYRPDSNDLNAGSTQSVLNVLPVATGYGPMKGVNQFSFAMLAQARGCFFARNDDGSIKVFAGTSTTLYALDNTTLTWTDVGRTGSPYAPLSANANWSFAQFNSVVIATQANDVVQAFTLGSSTDFDDLAGSPPQAAFVSIINRFVVLSGLASFPRRVQWSGLNAITTWTSGTTYSDYQDLPDGGNTQGVVGGELGIILQDSAIRRMVFSPGSDIIFQIDRIAKDVGVVAPWSVIDVGGLIFALTAKGFMKITADGGMTPIGKERVNATFLADYDAANPQLVIGVSNPETNVVLWAYKSNDYSGSGFNKLLAYDHVLDRWAPLEIEGEFICSLAKPGITLEGLGMIGTVAISGAADNGSGKVRLTVASTTGWTTGDIKQIAAVTGTTEANGEHTITVVDGTHIDLASVNFSNAYVSGGYVEGSIDDIEVSFDDISAATLSNMAIFDTEHKLGYFTGDNLEATLETAEQSGISKRLFIRGLYPITDAATAYCSVARRENLNATPSYTTETALNAQGFCPARASTRHARSKLRIPSGTSWTFATGVQPDFTYEGAR